MSDAIELTRDGAPVRGEWDGTDSWIAGLLVNIGKAITRSLAETPRRGLPTGAEATYLYKGMRVDVQLDFSEE
jgi:hypothetical protein